MCRQQFLARTLHPAGIRDRLPAQGEGILKPLVSLRHLQQRGTLRTGVAALVGARAVVLERVDAHGGRIKLAGEVWSARTYDPSAVVDQGAEVDVVSIEGATAVIMAADG